MTVLGVAPQPGEIVRQRVPIGALPDGTPITLPVIVAAGQREGPTVYLQSGVHGDEITGVAVLQRILAQVSAEVIRGTIVAVPIANPAAFITRTRGFALEERGPFDVNRIFPGNRNGVLSERIAAALFEELVLKADFVVDFHAGLAGCDMYPFVYVDPADDEDGLLAQRERMARAVGTDLAYYKQRGSKLGTSVMTGSLSTQAELNRKPSVTVEMGESGRVSWQYVDRAVAGGLNLLRELGALDGQPDPPREQRRFSTIRLVHGEAAGILEPQVPIGQDVSEGQLLGYVTDVFAGEHTPVTAPHDGIVLRVMLDSPVMPGAELFWIVW